MFTHAYIISWFGKDNREKRKEYHDIQVQWMLDKGLNVVILSQHYNKEEYFEHENVKDAQGKSEQNTLGGASLRSLFDHLPDL